MGAIPATMMVLAGRVHVGLEDPTLYHEMAQRSLMKVSQRELPFVLGMVWLLPPSGFFGGELTVRFADYYSQVDVAVVLRCRRH